MPMIAARASAGEVVYAARLAPDGQVAEERTVRCDVSTGCILAFEFAADDWRHGLSLQLSETSKGHLEIVARSEGEADGPLLMASAPLAGQSARDVVATLSLAPSVPPADRRRPMRAAQGPVSGFGPFLIAVHRLAD
jgi:hypothetical protein